MSHDPRPAPAARAPIAFLVLLLFAALTTSADRGPVSAPPILFVSRQPVPGEPLEVPGLGPHHRATITRGRLLRRDTNGTVREVLSPKDAPYDVCDPTVSPGGRRIAWAAVASPGGRWRIWIASASGDHARPVEAHDVGDRDDLDPCWIDDRTLVFASTRSGATSEYAAVPVTDLHALDIDSGAPARRITFDRNGAEEPAWDAQRGRIVYTRWWFNRHHRPARDADSVNLWHAVSIDRDGNDLRLAAGSVRSRRGTMAYQPAVLDDGSIAGVYALNTGLSPRPGALGIHRMSIPAGPSARVAGADLDDRDEAGYGTPRGLTAPRACTPAAAPGGGMLFALDSGGRSDFGIWIRDRKGRQSRLVDLPGTHELDPVALTRSRFRPAAAAPARATAVAATFEYFCRNLFRDGGTGDPGGPAPSWRPGLRLRFLATSTTTHGRDTLILVREAAVRPDSSVREAGLPADRPLFEQLVDSTGALLSTPHGVAEVPGYNYGRPGAVARCIGCHNGHSTLDAAAPDGALKARGSGRPR